MGEYFTLIKDIDFSKIDAVTDENEILIGYPEGMQHTPGFEGPAIDMADLAQKLSRGAGPQTWKTSKTMGRGKKKATVVEEHYVRSIPARPFIEDGIKSGVDEIDARAKKYYEKTVADGKPYLAGLHAIAVTAIGEIQKLVRGGYYENEYPNSPETIKAKGSDKPLIDTGQLLNSLTYVIGGTIHKEVKNADTGKSEWKAT